jgi:hypothetical protein
MGRQRPVRVTSGVAARRLRGASKRETSSEAAGRARNQRFRVTSARRSRPRIATSAESAETSQRGETSSRAAGRDRNQWFRVTSAHNRRRARSVHEQDEPDARCARGTSEGARRNSRTAECGRSDLRGSCLLQH